MEATPEKITELATFGIRNAESNLKAKLGKEVAFRNLGKAGIASLQIGNERGIDLLEEYAERLYHQGNPEDGMANVEAYEYLIEPKGIPLSL